MPQRHIAKDMPGDSVAELVSPPQASVPIADVTQRYEWLRLVALDRTISANAVRVAVLLSLHYFNQKKKLICPSHETLAAKLDLGSSTVRRATKDLEGAGYLNSFKAFGGSNRYVLHLPIRSQTSGLSDAETEGRNPLGNERIDRSEMSGLALSELGAVLPDENASPIRSKSSAQSARNRAPNHMKITTGGAPEERPPEIGSDNDYRRARDGGAEESGALAERHPNASEDQSQERAFPASENPATESVQDPGPWPPDPDEDDVDDDSAPEQELTKAEKEELRREFEEMLEAYDDDD